MGSARLLARPSGSEDDGEEHSLGDVCLGRGDDSPMGQVRSARGRGKTQCLPFKSVAHRRGA